MIYIDTTWTGITATAECVFDGKTYSKEGRTHANALSNLCSQLARVKAAKGQPWIAPKCGNVTGVIGETTKVKRRRIKDLPTFELLGGQMGGTPNA